MGSGSSLRTGRRGEQWGRCSDCLAALFKVRTRPTQACGPLFCAVSEISPTLLAQPPTLSCGQCHPGSVEPGEGVIEVTAHPCWVHPPTE